jgi:hypothetical protein
LSELGILDREVELEHIGKVENVVQSLGFRFVVKVHPAEDSDKYDVFDVDLIKGEAPAEVIFLNFSNVKFVLSFYSTAALNVSELLDVTAYFMYEKCGLDVNFPNSQNSQVIKSFRQKDLRSLFLSAQF